MAETDEPIFQGEVRCWNSDHSYGWIKRDDGQPNLFVHRNQLGGRESLATGMRIAFNVGTRLDGKRYAHAIRVLAGGERAA